jgi:hypothetical protein
MTTDYSTLPDDLPEPIDDGGADYHRGGLGRSRSSIDEPPVPVCRLVPRRTGG